MKNYKITLWDLPDNVYIKIKNPCRSNFFNYAIKLVGGTTRLAKLLKIKSIRNLYSYKNAELFTSLRIVKNILSMFPENKKSYFISYIENNIEEIKTSSNSKSLKNPRLPIRFSPEFSGLAGHIIGDGGIFDLNGTFVAHYSNKSRFLINQFKNYILDSFGDIEIYEYYDKRKNAYRLTAPSIIGLILSIFLEQQHGDSKHIPEFIISSNKLYKTVFLRALFDDEGSISGRAINISMSNKEVIIKIKKMLEEFCIKPGKIYETDKNRTNYRINITGQHDLARFSKQIGFSHPKKKEKLITLLQNYKIDRYKIGEMENIIVNLLSKNKSSDLFKLCKQLKRKPGHRIRKKLILMESKNILRSEIGENHKKRYYLDRVGYNYD